MLLLSALSVQCFSQVRKDADSTALGMCWSSNLDTSARYLVYYRYYQQGPDTNWNYVGITKSKEFYVPKGSLKGKLAFGVRSVWNNDTSDIHSSMDSTACLSEGTCDSCRTQGSWYANWHIKKAKGIGKK
jgi:hypothetical protein